LSASEREVVDGYGIQTVAVADGSTACDLAVQAVRGLMARTGADGSEVDALLVVNGRVPDFLMASETTRIQHDSGLNAKLAFGISDLGCASSSAALLTADALLRASADWRSVVIAHGCRPPGPYRNRQPVTVNGDAGLAVLVRRQEAMRLAAIAVESDGAYWDLFKLDYQDRPSAQWREVCADPVRYSFELAIQSRNRLNQLNRKVLADAGLKMSDIDHCVMQNVSMGAFRFYEDALDVRIADACRANLTAYGHLGPIDVLANLQAGVESKEFGPGDLVLAMNNSPVAAWSSMVVEI
jgi:3-oxoacyl-[acyl-carrier-protein] synthase-3